jgi:hypothetical protein
MKINDLLNEFYGKDLVKKSISLQYLNNLNEGKFTKKPIDIGGGFYLKGVGFDNNGNWSYWVSRGASGFRKLQASDVNGGKDKITDLNDVADPEYAQTIDDIKKYYIKFIAPKKIKENIDNAFYYIIDLNERGSFRAHVEDSSDNIIFEISNDDSEDGSLWIVEDGFMKHIDDVAGLEEYLKELEIIPENGKLYYEHETSYKFNESVDNIINFNFSSAKYQNISDTISYNIKDLTLETKNDTIIIPDAGILSLNLNGQDLVKELLGEVDDAFEITNVKLSKPISDTSISLHQINEIIELNKEDYFVTVYYKTEAGEEKEVDLNFNNNNFIPSNDFFQYVNSLY